MGESFAVLSCNGLDKCAGSISREIAINLAENSSSEIICPVLYRVSEARYDKTVKEKPVLVIDGCNTRCAGRLASDRNLKVFKKINVTDEAKNRKVDIGRTLRVGSEEQRLVQMIIADLFKEPDREEGKKESFLPDHLEYEIYKKDKFIFRVPKTGFYFNENDSWVYVSGNHARIGVTDFVQQSLSDIMYFTPPSIGSDIEQFGEIGVVESGKAVFEVVSPVSGKVIAVNEELITKPELLNMNPYEKGWIADVELSDFQNEYEMLLEFDGYFKKLKRKVDEFRVR